MSKSFIRILTLAESLSEAPKNGLSKSEVVERAGMATSTVYRLLTEMEEAGYVYRTSEGRLLPNFSFERRIGDGTISPELLREACAEVSNRLQTASEIILRRGHNLLWHVTDEHPMQPIKLRAHPGYVRATYELDSISRLVLAHCDIAEIERSWDTSAFYNVGIDGARVSWVEAREMILATDKQAMQFDMLGNAKGVRRYCIAVTDTNGNFVCILTAAEAAIPVRDEAEHVANIRNVLNQARASLQPQNSISRDDREFASITHQVPIG